MQFNLFICFILFQNGHFSQFTVHSFTRFLPLVVSQDFDRWNYANQDRWSEDDPECGGNRQSPIDLSINRVRENGKLELKFHKYNRHLLDYDVRNTGRSIQFSFTGNADEAPCIYGRALNGQQYILQQFHFHWGQETGIGSEHTINDIRYDMELHLVHYNRNRYGTFEEAFESHNGVVVVAILFEVLMADQDHLFELLTPIRQMVHHHPSNRSIPLTVPLRLDDFLPAAFDQEHEPEEETINGDGDTRFFRYSGSLTTPPCTEGITWLVAAQAATIGHRQIEVFRAIEFFNRRTEGNNYRHRQARNRRLIEISRQ